VQDHYSLLLLVLGIELENFTLLTYIQAVRASLGKDFHVLDVEEMEAYNRRVWHFHICIPFWVPALHGAPALIC